MRPFAGAFDSRKRPRRSAARLALACFVFATLLVAPASARAEDEGIAIGEGRLHPFLTLGGRWDSYATLDPSGHALSDFLFDINPGLRLKVPSPVLAFELDGDVDEVLYSQFSALNRTLAHGNLVLDFFNEGPVGLKISDVFTRANNATVTVLPYAIVSDLNDAALHLEIRPGGGALTFEPGADFIYEHFEGYSAAGNYSACPSQNAACNPANAPLLDYYTIEPVLNASWRFLPKTAVVLNSHYYLVNYINGGQGNAPLGLFDATLGLSGLITSHFEVIAKAGYAQTFLSSDALKQVPGLKAAGDAQTVVGQAEVGYLLSETGSVRLGFLRVLQPIPSQLGYFVDDRPYVNARLMFGRLLLHLDASLDVESFPNNLESTGKRTDLLLHLDVGPDVEIARWFRAGVGYDLTALGSDDSAAFAIYNTAPLLGTVGYANSEFYLRLTFAY